MIFLPKMCICACVCKCVSGVRKEREGEKEIERLGENERDGGWRERESDERSMEGRKKRIAINIHVTFKH